MIDVDSLVTGVRTRSRVWPVLLVLTVLTTLATGCAWRYDEGGFQWAVIGGLHSKRPIDATTWDAEHRDHAPCWIPLAVAADGTILLPPPGRRTAEGFVTAYTNVPPAAISIFTDEVSPPADDRNADELTLRHSVCVDEKTFYGELHDAAQTAEVLPDELRTVQILQVTGLPMCDDAHGRLVHQYACSDGYVVEVSRGASHAKRLTGMIDVLKRLKEQRLLGSDKR